jgi:hypothetical protein
VRSTRIAAIPPASSTAKAVRTRRQRCASEPAHACFRTSHAHNTRVESGARPRGVRGGKRGAKLWATAVPNAAPGKVSAPCRRPWGSGTTSVPARCGPCPVIPGWRCRRRRLVLSP